MLERVVLPGEVVECGAGEQQLVAGPGLRRGTGDQLTVVRAGVLRQKEGVSWVDCHARRYTAARGENVIGVVRTAAH